MPNYPSSYSNTGPYSAGPVNNTQLYYDIHNRIMRHNLIPVVRIVQSNITLTPITNALGTGSNGLSFMYYDTNNYFISGLVAGSVVALVDQGVVTNSGAPGAITAQAGPQLNGIYIYTPTATGSATGPSLTRAANLSSISALGVVSSPLAWATNTGSATGFLNQLLSPAGQSVGTGSTSATTGSQLSLFPIQTLIDEAGVAYPQGFIAYSGSTTDNTGVGVNPSSNVGKIVYYTQEQLFSNTAYAATGPNYGGGTGPNFSLGIAPVNFSSLQNLNLTYPTSYNDTDRNVYNTSTMGDFFINIRVASDLMQQILSFRSGNGADLSAAQQVYIANLKAQRILWIKTRLTFMLGDLYDLYKTFYTVLYQYSVATGSKGANTPSTYNRGYNIYHQS